MTALLIDRGQALYRSMVDISFVVAPPTACGADAKREILRRDAEFP
jgi:hypothetical protein